MKIVDASNFDKNFKITTPQRLKNLLDKSFKSFNSILDKLQEGDHVTVQVAAKGYKNLGVKDGKGWIQRNFVYEY
jgi:hypothetical protein